MEGDWSSRSPYCSVGLTFRNQAEATFNGYSLECGYAGVCNYGVRDGQNMSYIPTTGGKGRSVAAAASSTTPPANDSAPYDYIEALSKTLIYFDAQLSGALPVFRLDWRGDSCTGCRGDYGEDLSGGYYESGGSTMKMSVVHNFQTSILAWAGVAFKGGLRAAGVLSELKWKVKHGADFLLNSVVSESPLVFMAVYGNSTQDFDNFSPVELFERYVPARPAGYLKGADTGSEATGGAAAALAASSFLLRTDLPDWSAEALRKAKALYAFASANPRSFRDSADPVVQNMQMLYATNGEFADELAWAAAWLYRATGEERYLAEARDWFGRAAFHNTLETWNYYPAAAVLLSAMRPGEAAFSAGARQFFDQYLNLVLGHTDAGAVYAYHWSSNAQVGNVAFLAAIHAANERAVDAAYRARLLNYGHFQTDYLLGDAGRSWVIGFGHHWPKYVWHKGSYFSTQTWTEAMGELIWTGRDVGPWSSKKTGEDKVLQRGQMVMISSLEPNPHILYGGVWGSPLQNDGLVASRKDYTYAEPANPTNTAIVGALAHMVEYFGLAGAYEGDMTGVNHVDYDELLTS